MGPDPQGTGPLPSEDEADRFFTEVPRARSRAPRSWWPLRPPGALTGRRSAPGTPSTAPRPPVQPARTTSGPPSSPTPAARRPTATGSGGRPLSVAGRRPVPVRRAGTARARPVPPPPPASTPAADLDPKLVVPAALAAAVLVAGAVWLSPDRVAVPGPSVPLQSLATGDCFRGTPAMTSSPVEPVSCARRHDGRVVGRARLLDDDVTPGRPIADGGGRRACAAALQDGWPADDGAWWAAVPSWPDFVDGARVVVCGSPD